MSIKRHKGYNTIKLLIEGGKITALNEIFDHLPKSVIKVDLGINYHRFTGLLKKVDGFKLSELYTLSHLIGVDEKLILDLAHAQYLADKKNIRKSK